MWRLKQFIPKEQAGLEGKTVEVGALKLQVRSTIAQGGFSCVYLARDSTTGRQYAVKHIICNDAESVDLVKNEVAVMKVLRGHPNVVTLHSQVIYDMGRTKECFLVMDYCEKMLANVLEQRGAGYFEEKQLLLIFRDICNAVYAMHCQSPPIAHRDLKVENVLMGGDGTWKLCDFGSTSTNHRRFEKADEMGLEEDIIRKHTTPAYRAPEMWDLFRRELISEKVDIWALGCLLYRIAYLKSAFDGESKLQILNGNYRIPEAPKYSTAVVDLIRSMLTAEPSGRPDVMQVWRRVNDALPNDIRKSHPDKPHAAPASREPPDSRLETRPDQRSHSQSKSSMPGRSPPLPPQKEPQRPPQNGTGATVVGAFWSTQYAQDAVKQEGDTGSDKSAGFDHSSKLRSSSPGSRSRREDSVPPEKISLTGQFLKKNPVTNLIKKVQGAGSWGRDDPEHNGYEMRNDSDDQKEVEEEKGYSQKQSSPATAVHDKSAPSNDAAFNEFAAHFDSSVNLTTDAGSRNQPDTSNRTQPDTTIRNQSEAASRSHHDVGSRSYADTGTRSPMDSGNRNNQLQLQADLDRLNKELFQARAEKAVVSSQYEKLTAICRSQRQEIQELKTALASVPTSVRTRNSPAGVHSVHSQPHPQQQAAPGGWQAFDQAKERQCGTIWDLQEGLSPVASKSQSQRFGHGVQGLSPGASKSQSQRFGQGLQEGPLPGASKSRSQRFVQEPSSSEVSSWQAFSDSPKSGSPSPAPEGRKRPVQQHARAASMGGDAWGFGQGQDAFSSSNNGAPTPTGIFGNVSTYTGASSNSPVPLGESRSSRSAVRNQPAGWAGF